MHPDIRKILNIHIESPYWDETVEKAEAMPAVHEWLTKEFICTMQADFALLGEYKESVLRAAELVAQNPDLCLLAKILYCIMAHKSNYHASCNQWILPQAKNTLSPVCFCTSVRFELLYGYHWQPLDF